MIPLIRPQFPNIRSIERNFFDSWAFKQFSNQGVVWERAVKRLGEISGGCALPVTSGTTAITVALTFLGLRGKRVALPDFTHSGTLLAVVQAGAVPVLFGTSPKSWTLEPEVLREYRREFDAAIVVSPFGYFVDVPAYDLLSEDLNFPIVYDLAGAFGHFPKTNNICCYSFHSTKNFGVGEGGMLVLPSQERWEMCRRITNFGTLSDRSIENDEGFNGKIDELKAATILATAEEESIGRVWKRIQNKNATLKFYKEQIGTYVPPGPKKTSLCVLGGLPAQELEKEGAKAGITFRAYYPLLSRMPGLSHIKRITVSGDALTRCVALPSDVSWDEAYRVVDFVKQFVGGKWWNQ